MKKKLPQKVWARVLDSTAASPKRSEREKSAQANHHWCRVYSRLVNNVTEKFSINQGWQTGRLPFVRTVRSDQSNRKENYTINQNHSSRSALLNSSHGSDGF